MLTTYLLDTRRLLQNPQALSTLYTDANLTRFVNIGRRQLAAEAQCIRAYGTVPTVASQRVYNFNGTGGITIPNAATLGIGNVIQLRQGSVVIGDGQARLNNRPFEYFQLYFLNEVVPKTGRPKEWSEYGQGVNGSLYVHPLPDDVYSLAFDTACLPIDLADDTTPEAIPSIWTDAVPFYAAYYALMSAQRNGDADKMYERYQVFVQRARGGATPDVLPSQYPQNTDPTNANKLGMKPPRGGGGQQ